MNPETVDGLLLKSKHEIGNIEIEELNLPAKIFCCRNGQKDSDYLARLLGIESLADGVLKKPLRLLQSESGTETGEDISKPLAIDLFCGGFGWTQGFVQEGWRCVGFDLEHEPWHGNVPADSCKVLADVFDLHGSMFCNADCIVCSPPCQEFSYMAMPWSIAKLKEFHLLAGWDDPKRLTALFDACFRIQREAIEAAGHFIPLVVENVRGAQKWVGRSRWNCGSMHFWGDVPALMPTKRYVKEPVDPRNRKTTGGWFYDNYETSHRRWSSGSAERKQWSAEIAKVPIELSTWIARCFKPTSLPA
ncbi:MAG: hypothetical protein NUV75_02195 [Gallionella sp.]|nr:hypothetical protein [Gallionella sp.]